MSKYMTIGKMVSDHPTINFIEGDRAVIRRISSMIHELRAAGIAAGKKTAFTNPEYTEDAFLLLDILTSMEWHATRSKDMEHHPV